MNIIILKENYALIKQVISLADKNSNTLGFIPQKVFNQKANESKIIVAVDGDDLCGYLLFDYNIKYHLAYIVHLCVDSCFRRKGIAKLLLRELENILENTVGGIRVKCRKDYEANKIWRGLGFKFIQTVPGRSKRGSKLDVWRKDLPFPNLFETIPIRKEPLINACLDLNILSDFAKSKSSSTESAYSIMEDWLIDITEFNITPELFVELERYEDEKHKNKIKELAKRYNLITCNFKEYQQIRTQLKTTLKGFKSTSVQNQSDISHIAWCACANLNFFVTSDQKLHQSGIEIYNSVGVNILYPVELLLQLNRIRHSVEYQPQRFSESEINIKRFSEEDFELIEPLINSIEIRGKKIFRRQLTSLLTRPNEITTQIVIYNENILGIISWEIIPEKKFIVHLIRFANIKNTETLTYGIINWMIQKSLDSSTPIITIMDRNLSGDVVQICSDFGFCHCDGKLVKLTERGHYSINEISDKLNNHEATKTITATYKQKIVNNLERAESSRDNTLLLLVEKEIWPIKIKQIKIPTYVVSIEPHYARQLFDYKISPIQPELFGVDSRLLFNIENSYYRSAGGRIIKAPARILWYVNKGKGRYSNSMAIRASSYLDEIHVGTPQELYKQFQHLGIYEWKDVLGIAHNDKLKLIMAFVFSRTEIFAYPISREALNEIWLKERGKKFHVQAPLNIADKLYWLIYKKGLGLSDEKSNVE